MARYNKFDKTRGDPFPISRSGIDQFIRDPRTFVLQRKYGVKPPSFAPLTLAIATDHLLKNEFDGYRDKQSSAWRRICLPVAIGLVFWLCAHHGQA